MLAGRRVGMAEPVRRHGIYSRDGLADAKEMQIPAQGRDDGAQIWS
jgi:hypothetical protein